jgi:hypothetical protein
MSIHGLFFELFLKIKCRTTLLAKIMMKSIVKKGKLRSVLFVYAFYSKNFMLFLD